jgi:hypothetical protein
LLTKLKVVEIASQVMVQYYGFDAVFKLVNPALQEQVLLGQE